MRRRGFVALGLGALALGGTTTYREWDRRTIKRLVEVEPGRIFRGEWPRPVALERLISRYAIRSVITLTAINRDDPKYVAQEPVLRDHGVDWTILPMRGSTATPEQMAEAADLVASRRHQPAFFHCVGGHHRSNLVHAAYAIRYRGLSADEAWALVSGLPWSRPSQDVADRRRIEEFAAIERARHTEDSA